MIHITTLERNKTSIFRESRDFQSNEKGRIEDRVKIIVEFTVDQLLLFFLKSLSLSYLLFYWTLWVVLGRTRIDYKKNSLTPCGCAIMRKYCYL